MSHTLRVDLDWPFERINLDSSISTRYVLTTEQLALLTKGAFTTIQWKSLMRLSDDHPPSCLNLTAVFQNHHVLCFLLVVLMVVCVVFLAFVFMEFLMASITPSENDITSFRKHMSSHSEQLKATLRFPEATVEPL